MTLCSEINFSHQMTFYKNQLFFFFFLLTKIDFTEINFFHTEINFLLSTDTKVKTQDPFLVKILYKYSLK